MNTLAGMIRLTDSFAELLRSSEEGQSLASPLRGWKSGMQEVEFKKLMEPDFTVSLRPARAPLMIIDEAVIPGDYRRPQPAKLDRMGLISALSNGRDIAGGVLGNPPLTIAVRTKGWPSARFR